MTLTPQQQREVSQKVFDEFGEFAIAKREEYELGLLASRVWGYHDSMQGAAIQIVMTVFNTSQDRAKRTLEEADRQGNNVPFTFFWLKHYHPEE